MHRARNISKLWVAWQATWGLPQTALGLAVSRMPSVRVRGAYRSEIVASWQRPQAMSLGLFIFIPDVELKRIEGGGDPFLLKHEYGHAVQSAILGPLYLPLVGIPSALWSNLPSLRRWRAKAGYGYYDFLVEKSASHLGGIR